MAGLLIGDEMSETPRIHNPVTCAGKEYWVPHDVAVELAAANAKLEAPKVSAGKRCEAGHDGYWTTLYGNCMACRVKVAERRVTTLESALLLAHGHMQVWLSHYHVCHNVHDAVSSALSHSGRARSQE